MTGFKRVDEKKQVEELDHLIRTKKLREAVERIGFMACAVGWHKWSYPKHNAVRNCLRCIETQAIDTVNGRWIKI